MRSFKSTHTQWSCFGSLYSVHYSLFYSSRDWCSNFSRSRSAPKKFTYIRFRVSRFVSRWFVKSTLKWGLAVGGVRQSWFLSLAFVVTFLMHAASCLISHWLNLMNWGERKTNWLKLDFLMRERILLYSFTILRLNYFMYL